MTEVEERTNMTEIRTLILEGREGELFDLFSEADARERTYIMAHLSMTERIRLMNVLPAELAADIIQEIPDAHATDIISEMKAENAVSIVNEMESDEQADLIMELEDEEAEAILSEMEYEDAEDVRRLIEFDPDTAGGLMITEFITLAEEMSVIDTVHYLRKNVEEISEYQVRYLYVINDKSEFRGIVQMQDLVLAEPGKLLGELIHEAKSFSSDTELEDLHGFFEAYDFIGVPVIDLGNRIIGVVLRRDVLRASSERLSKEHLESQGIVGGEELRTMPIWLRSRRRLSWLSVNILLNIVAASVIAFHQDTLSSVIALAVFLPIISDMSGCSGNQAVAVSMRELSIGTVKPREFLTVWGQELSVGLINGTVLGLLIAGAAFLWKGNMYLGMVAGGALALNTMVAVSLGGTLPLILKGMDIDPALASGPILTTITDMLGFFLTLTFATIVLTKLQGI